MTPSSIKSKKHHQPEANIRTYVVGFVLSVALTLLAFWLAPALETFALPTIVALAIAQLFVQLIFFLHLGNERDTHFTVGMFGFTIVIIGILLVGTLWIMSNLAHLHMSSPTEHDMYQGGMPAPKNELR